MGNIKRLNKRNVGLFLRVAESTPSESWLPLSFFLSSPLSFVSSPLETVPRASNNIRGKCQRERVGGCRLTNR